VRLAHADPGEVAFDNDSLIFPLIATGIEWSPRGDRHLPGIAARR
jgi:hypothetical protein